MPNVPDLEVVRVGDPGRFPLALVAGVVDHRGEPLALDKRVKSQREHVYETRRGSPVGSRSHPGFLTIVTMTQSDFCHFDSMSKFHDDVTLSPCSQGSQSLAGSRGRSQGQSWGQGSDGETSDK